MKRVRKNNENGVRIFAIMKYESNEKTDVLRFYWSWTIYRGETTTEIYIFFTSRDEIKHIFVTIFFFFFFFFFCHITCIIAV